MRHVAVAVPADLSFAHSSHHIVHFPGVDQCGVEVGVTTNAVVHDDLICSFTRTWRLTFEVGHELRYMVKTIGCFEEVLTGDVLMGNMAIVACSIARMARMKPCGIIGRHDMTVDACRRVIAQIAMSSQDVQKE